MVAILTVSALVASPFLLLLPLWQRQRSGGHSFLHVLVAVTGLLLLAEVGRWDVLGYWMRLAWLVALCLSLVAWLRRHRTPAVPATPRWTATAVVNGVLFLLFATGAAWALMGRRYPGDAVQLQFPLADGTYYIAQGGSNVLVNYHHAFLPQQFALDIVKLAASRSRARGVSPARLQDYVIFDAPVLSPCDGLVVEAIDGRPDQAIGTSDQSQPAGNHVAIACRDVQVLLAHLRQGSVRVTTGARVGAGELLGHVGNSGNTSEPHLHVHAQQVAGDHAGVPIEFDGRYLVRNDRYQAP